MAFALPPRAQRAVTTHGVDLAARMCGAIRRTCELTGHLAELLARRAELEAELDRADTIQLHESARLAVRTIVRLLAPPGAAPTVLGVSADPAEMDAWVDLLDELLTDAQASYGGAQGRLARAAEEAP
jgi:hypothetical protein